MTRSGLVGGVVSVREGSEVSKVKSLVFLLCRWKYGYSAVPATIASLYHNGLIHLKTRAQLKVLLLLLFTSSLSHGVL